MARASRETWLAEGLVVLGDSGPAAISVELLSARLGVSKASFHWHFGDREAFLRELVAHWSERARDGDGRHLFTADPKVERAMRAWAVEDPAIADVVRGVDGARLAALARIYAAAPEPDRAARLEYAAFVGATWLFEDLADDGARALAEDVGRALSAWKTAPKA